MRLSALAAGWSTPRLEPFALWDAGPFLLVDYRRGGQLGAGLPALIFLVCPLIGDLTGIDHEMPIAETLDRVRLGSLVRQHGPIGPLHLRCRDVEGVKRWSFEEDDDRTALPWGLWSSFPEGDPTELDRPIL